MRRTPTILLALGIVTAATAIAWQPLVTPRLTAVPTSLSVAEDFSGTLTTFVDQRTGSPLASPLRLPAAVNLKVTSSPGSTGDRVVVRQVTSTTIASAPTTTTSQYVLDRGTGRAVSGGGEGAWVLNRGNPIRTTGGYVLGPPVGAHAAEYPLWVDELLATVPLLADGSSTTIHGLSVRGFEAKIGQTPMPDAYVAGLGLPTTEPFSAVAGELKGAGVDLVGILSGMRSLTPAEATAVEQLPAMSVPTHYSFSLDLRMLVEPDTGAVVDIPKQIRSISATVDLSQVVSALTPVLQTHASDPAVQRLLPLLSQVGSPPTRPLTTLELSQTDASVVSLADRIGSDRRELLLLMLWLPMGVGALAAILLVAALVVQLRGRRRPEDAVAAELAPAGA